MRWILGLAAALGSVWALRLILGPWQAAIVVCVLGLAALIAGWALLDRKLFEPPPLPVRRYEQPIDARVLDR